VQEVSDLASGWRAERASVGFTANIIIAGEVTCQIGAERKVHKAGEAWSAPAGTLLGEVNTSASTARVFTTYLLPRGAGR
jgi:quercetin dioxygenase-like cupin family protein